MDKENRAAVAQLSTEKVQENPDFFKRMDSWNELSFILQEAMNKQKGTV